MKSVIMAVLVAVGLTAGAASFAQTTPAVTATCKDGTTFSGPSKKGACSHHGGVQAYTTPGTTATPPAATTAAPATPSAPATTGAAAPPPASPATNSASTSVGHAGQVWVNTSSKVYHCPGDRYFGKTKHGEYMTEANAKAGGFRPSHGKTCSS